MDEIREGDVVKYITVDLGSDASKYKDQFGFVNTVGTKFCGKVLYSVKFIDKKIVYGIPEDCIRKATDDEERIFCMKYANKLLKTYLLDSMTLTSGKLYSDGKFVADVKEENKSMFKVGDHVITTRASWVIPAGTKGYVIGIDPVKGIYVGYKNGVDTPHGHLMTRWTDPYDLKVISLEEYDKRMIKKENKNMLCIGDKVKTSRPVWIIPSGKIGTVIDVNAYGCRVLFDTPIHDHYGSEIKIQEISHADLVLIYKYKDQNTDLRNFSLTPTPMYFTKNFARPKKVIFSGNRTVVLWSDGDKTIVKANCEAFDREKGLAMAIAKKVLGTNPSKSNYYDVFKKWIPEELIEQHAVESEPKDFPMNAPEEEEKPWNPSMRHQISSDEIVDKIMAGADTEDLKKSIEKSKKILDAEKKGVRPSISGYFPSDPTERGPIQNFVEKFKPGYFPAEFITFCKKHNLGFVVDGNVVNPYEIKWQNVAGLLRRGVITMRKKINPNDGHEYMAVDMENMLFQRLPRNNKDNKEEVKND